MAGDTENAQVTGNTKTIEAASNAMPPPMEEETSEPPVAGETENAQLTGNSETTEAADNEMPPPMAEEISELPVAGDTENRPVTGDTANTQPVLFAATTPKRKKRKPNNLSPVRSSQRKKSEVQRLKLGNSSGAKSTSARRPRKRLGDKNRYVKE